METAFASPLFPNESLDAPMTHFAAIGFWLPCDQAHFFHHQGHQTFRRTVALTDANLSGEQNILNDQVYHRLVMTLATRGYSHAIPVYHSERPFGKDPDAGVFVRMGERERAMSWKDETGKDQSVALPSSVNLGGLALLVNSSGFYLLLAGYSVAEGEEPALTDEGRRSQVQAFLEAYLYDLVGGAFASRYSGWPEDAPMAIDEYERDNPLKDFAEKRKSILVFNQINTIFESLYSSALDPRVFFNDNSSVNAHAIQDHKRTYSLGSFVRLIATEVARGDYAPPTPADEAWAGDPVETDEIEDEAVAGFLRALRALHPDPIRASEALAESPTMRAQAHYLCHYFLGERGCGVILRKFLQATASESLEPYKRRVERCRRALLQEILEVTQHQDPLLQTENPDEGHDHIPSVNEAQLRGYALLCSAKLPLLNNVRLYLTEIGLENAWFWAAKKQDGTGSSGASEVAAQEIKATLAMWETLYEAVENDVHGLEKAIAQERQDTLVREEMKVRVEQETLAEIERLRERDAKSLSPRTTITINFLANLFAMASVVVAVVSVLLQHQPPPQPQAGWGVSTFVQIIAGSGAELVFIALALVVIYMVAQVFASVVLRMITFTLRRIHINWGERFYYEMDLHMEAPLDRVAAVDLLEGRLPRPISDRLGIPGGALAAAVPGGRALRQGLALWKSVWAFIDPRTLRSRITEWGRISGFERNSYRVERMTSSEAMHKLYVEFSLRLPWSQPYPFPRRVSVVLVYEFYFHQAAESPRYILQDVRVISTNSIVLSQRQLDYLKAFIADTFVNPLIPRTEGPWTIQTEPRSNIPADSLMSLTRPAPSVAPSAVASAWRKVNLQARAVRLVGICAGAIYLVRGIIMALTYGATHGGEHVLFENGVFAYATGIDEIVAFASQQWWLMLLPVGWVALAGLGSLASSGWRRVSGKRTHNVTANAGNVGSPYTSDKTAPERFTFGQRLAGGLGFVVIASLRIGALLSAIALGTAGFLAFLPSVVDFAQWFMMTIWR